jgi:uncharacterized protein (DUF2062 family)
MTGDILENIRLIGFFPVDTPIPDIKTTIRRMRDVHDQVVLVYYPDIIPDITRDYLSDGYGETVFIVQSSQSNRRAMLRTAVAEARRLNMTHILIHDPESTLKKADISRLVDTAGSHPGSVIIGERKPFDTRLPTIRQIMWRGAAFTFRLQTGVDLRDPGCPVRVYPLWVFDCLKIKTRHNVLDAEILVKAAWAGVPIQRVALETPFSQTYQQKSFFSNLGEWGVKSALHFHWIMRSITPIPHRKVVDDQDHQNRKVSIWHPVRSIRTLLTENLTPMKLAWAVALGIFLGTLPLIALHTVTILLAAGFFRLNKAAALAASQLCMPPFVPALCIETGHFLRHGRFLTEISMKTIGYQALERGWEWLLGALILAPLLALLLGGVVYGIGQTLSRKSW